MSDEEQANEIRWKNRRRMAWVSLALGAVTSLVVILCSMFVPGVAERVEKIDAVFIGFLTFCGTTIVAYMGGTIAMNWKHGK